MVDKLREEKRVQMVKDQMEKDRRKCSSASPVKKSSSADMSVPLAKLVSSDSLSFVILESPDLDDTKSVD
jgi:hypothetical protein